MKHLKLRGVETPASVIVQGAMGLLNLDEADAMTTVDAAFAAGINTFDTAHIYAWEDKSVDALLGRWLASSGVRQQLVLMAKGAHPEPPDWEAARVTPEHVAADVADSLERMNTERFDVWSFHRDDPSVPVGELVDAVNREVDAGRIDAWGVSNWSVQRIGAARDHAKANGGVGPAVNSAHFSLVDQVEPPWDDVVTLTGNTAEADRQWHGDHDIPVAAWSTLAGGFLSSTIERADLDDATEGHLAEVARCYSSETNWLRRERATEVAHRLGVTLSDVAIAWVLAAGQLDAMAIVGGATSDEVRQNAAAAEIQLTPADRAYLVGGPT